MLPLQIARFRVPRSARRTIPALHDLPVGGRTRLTRRSIALAPMTSIGEDGLLGASVVDPPRLRDRDPHRAGGAERLVGAEIAAAGRRAPGPVQRSERRPEASITATGPLRAAAGTVRAGRAAPPSNRRRARRRARPCCRRRPLSSRGPGCALRPARWRRAPLGGSRRRARPGWPTQRTSRIIGAGPLGRRRSGGLGRRGRDAGASAGRRRHGGRPRAGTRPSSSVTHGSAKVLCRPAVAVPAPRAASDGERK